MNDLTAGDCYLLATEGCSDSEILAYAAIRRDGRIGWPVYAQVREWLHVIRQDERNHVREAA